jgi:hypothetical protein
MEEHNNIFHKNEDEIVDWGDNFTSQVVTNAAALQIPAQEATDIQTAFTTFKGLHAQAKSPTRNPIITAEKNAAKDEFLRLVRENDQLPTHRDVFTGKT